MQKNIPLISVIVPIYGVEKFIEKFSHSLLSQTMTDNIEFLFIDDCTKDSSIEILKSVILDYPHIENQCKIIHHQKNRGLAASRNTGMRHAKGIYVLHLDSDDWLSPKMLEKMSETIINDNSIDIVICDYYGAYLKKNIAYHQKIPSNPHEVFKKMLRGEMLYAPWNKLIKRSLFYEWGIEWIEGLNMWEDVSVMPKIVYHSKKIVHLPQALYYYNQQNNNSYTKKWNIESSQNVLQAYELITDFVKKLNDSGDYKKDIESFTIISEFALLSHSKISEINNVLASFPALTVYKILKSSLPQYKKVAYILYIHSMPKLGHMLLKIIEDIKRHIR